MTTPNGLSESDRVHACTVNGLDAQHWYDEAMRWRDRAGEEHMRGQDAANRRWAKATGCIDIRAYLDSHANARQEQP